MIFGYLRISKNKRNNDLQLDALKKAGCERIFIENNSETSEIRPEYLNMISEVRKGDKIVVWKMDCLGRANKELIKLMVEFDVIGVEFRSVSEDIDTSNTTGRLLYTLSSILVENERDIIVERTRVGLERARAGGRVGGRPKGLTRKSQEIANSAANLYQSKKYTTTQICETLKIGSKATLYNYLRYKGIKIDGWVRANKSQA